MTIAVFFPTAEAAEQAFYDALQRGDLRALMAVWAADDGIICVHPGGERLVGVEPVRNSWAQILADGGLNVRPRDPRVFDSDATSVRCVVEQVRVETSSGARVAECLSTNVFGRVGTSWHLLIHHASPGHENEAETATRHTGVLH